MNVCNFRPPGVKDLVSRTAGFYMMANQVTMLGLAQVPISSPINVTQSRDYSEAEPKLASQTDSLSKLLSERAGLNPQTNLEVVSFNDSNDLLTWHIPPWYSSGDVKIEDVFVGNAFRWFWLFEWPLSAHDGYFSNNSVWQVMYCGATDGHVTKCRH